MQSHRENFTCPICTELFKKPVECLNCGNNYCLECFERIRKNASDKKLEEKCPLCNTSPFIVKPNEALSDMMKGMRFKCKICSNSFYRDEFKNHIKTCKLFNCIICNEEIFSINKMIEHFSNEIVHKEYIINLNNNFCFKDRKKLLENSQETFLENENKKIIKRKKETPKGGKNLSQSSIINPRINYRDINLNEPIQKIYIILKSEYESDQNDIKKVEYQDFIGYKKQKSKENNNIVEYSYNLKILNGLPPGCKYYQEEDLIYCGKETNLNCKCCNPKICVPGNCFCINCMYLNLSYHYLKKKLFLINRKGRVCSFDGKKYYYCGVTYKIKNKDSQGNMFAKKFECNNKTLCDDCKLLNKISKEYLRKL